ncbi:Lrp/AsnC family transcriptional regulator [Mumia sp. Pv 4-285]|uniref:Lrp/AsnC family transcriptional regulator n=1 Tax=Mumia qirimensis TaxID=3234852 RepID=UPI00351D1617
MTTVPTTESRLDEIDRRLLWELSNDGRASVNELSSRLHVSRANAYARLRRMLDAGVIEQFGAQVSPQRAGLGTSALVLLTIRQAEWRDVRDRLARVPGVDHIALCAGTADVVVLVRTSDTVGLREIVLEEIRTVPGVLASRTTLILDEARGGSVPSVFAGTLAEQAKRRHC